MALESCAAAMAYVLLALAASAARAGSHSHAPTLAVDCVSQTATLIDCLDYVHQGSTKRWLVVAGLIRGRLRIADLLDRGRLHTPLLSMGRRV
jgi:hypothetical protein